MTGAWSGAVDEVLGGDQVVMLASVTPAGGVVLTPVTNFATRDRAAGRVTVNSSVGAGRKLARIRANPHVALAFHTRDHAFTDRPEYVLVQGTATVSAPVDDYPATLGDAWERFDGPSGGRLWKRWLRVYHRRVAIDVTAHRVLVWPDLAATGPPAVTGEALPDQPPPSQRAPAGGTAPRVDGSRAATLPHVLLGWEGADRFPVVVPVGVVVAGSGGGLLRLEAAGPHLPPGGRRAGLTAHAFTRHVVGQYQRVHTGWLTPDAGGRTAAYAPHTAFGYRMPASPLVNRLLVGFATRRGIGEAT